MCFKFTIVNNIISKNSLFHIIHLNVGIFLALYTFRFPETMAFPSGVHVAGYKEENVPIYPFQQYIQVRKEYTVEHVPLYDDQEDSHNLQASASNSHHGNSENHQDDDHEHGSGGNHYYVPRLREAISDYKKQEVYEEKGYGDSDYDHHSYTEPSRHHHYDDNSDDGTTISDSSSASNVASTTGHRPYRHQSRHTLHTPDGQSTKFLEYVANNLHDGDAQRQGIYAARSNIYCPEVIDFDLSSKSMGMGKGVYRKAKPRLHGLGYKITCLKNKYFGAEPLPKAIFLEPSESKESVIEVPSFGNFFNMIRRNVDSYSSFQNSNVPI